MAAGAARDLWIFTLAGWFLIHGHAAYLFFVPGLTAVVLVALCWPRRGRILAALRTAPWASLGAFLGRQRRAWIPAAAISAVFLLPIVINLALHWPGSFGKYFSYGSSSQAGGRSAGAVIKYVLWFWWPGSTAPAARSCGVHPAAQLRGRHRAGLVVHQGAGAPVPANLLGLNVVSLVLFIAYSAVGIDNLTRNGHYIGYFFWSAPLLTLTVAAVALAGALAKALAGTPARRLLAAVAAALVAAGPSPATAAAPLLPHLDVVLGPVRPVDVTARHRRGHPGRGGGPGGAFARPDAGP